MSRALSPLLLLLAVASAAWGLLGDSFRDSEGLLDTPACLPLGLAAGLFVWGLALLGGWGRSGGWVALAIAGQASLLQITRAGTHVGYQHLRPLAEDGPHWTPIGILAAQALAVAFAVRPLLAPAARWIGERLGGFRALLLLLGLVVASAKISRPASAWGLEMVAATVLQLVQVANVVLAARALDGKSLARWRARLDRWLGPAGGDRPEPGGLDGFAWTLAVFATLLAAGLCWFSYERHPHVPDEVVYLIHGEYFARGMLTLPAPPVPDAFEVDLMLLENGRWFCPVPVGWPLVLALGSFAGVPWLVNPLLGGASVLLAYLFLREIATRRFARTTTFLLALSPWFTFLNMSFMTHSLTLFGALLGALGVARSRRTGSLGWTVLAGAGIGVTALIRPLEGAAVAVLLGLWAIGVGGRRLRLAAVALLVASTAAVSAIALPYNAHLTGKPTKFAIMHYIDRVYGPGKNDLGFGPEKGLGWGGLDPFPGHGARDVVVNADFNVFAVGVELLGWSTGSLGLILLLLLTGRLGRRERLMLAMIVVIVGLHSFYWFSGGPDFGARYWYLILVPCLVLVASGLERLTGWCAAPDGSDGDADGSRVPFAAAVLCLSALVTFFPWRAIDKYHHYRGMRPDVRRLAREHEFGRSLVLVRGERHPDYASAWIYNPLDLEADAPIYAWDRSPEVRAEVVQHYADRPVWLVDGPSVTSAGFEVVAGPLSSDAVLGR